MILLLRDKYKKKEKTVLSYHTVSLFLGILIGVVIFLLLRKNHMHIKYSVFWLLLATAILLFGIFPRLSDKIASIAGVSYPPILIIVVGIGLILIKILTMDIERSKHDRDLRILTEKLAVFEGMKSQEDLKKI